MAEQPVDLPGRNLTQEVDEIRERMGEVTAAQTRMEETLQTIRDTITLLSTRVMGQAATEEDRIPIPLNVEIPQNRGFDGMIGLGYEAINPNEQGGGMFHAGNGMNEGRGSMPRDTANQSWMDKM